MPRLMRCFTGLLIAASMLSGFGCLSKRLENDSAPFVTNDMNTRLKTRQEACEQAGKTWKHQQCVEPPVVLTAAEKCQKEAGKKWDAATEACVPATLSLSEACVGKDEATCTAIQEEICRSLGKQLSPDGRCKTVLEQHEFAYYCAQGEKAASDIRQTVVALMANVEMKTCEEAAAALKGKEMLSLQGLNLVSLAPLYGMSQLVHVILANNRIRDLTPLASLPRLRYLDLYQNAVADAAPLAGLAQLEFLYINKNPLTSLAALAGLNKLRELPLEGILLGSSGPGGVAKNEQNCPSTAASVLVRDFCAKP